MRVHLSIVVVIRIDHHLMELFVGAGDVELL